MSKPLTDAQLEALDSLIGYVIETEFDDYEERVDEGDDVEGHVYLLAMELAKVFDVTPSV
tara:strand:- start:1065 stop:1244 length:180 start_codon:yes stop_codon:yes gene_type:complete